MYFAAFPEWAEAAGVVGDIEQTGSLKCAVTVGTVTDRARQVTAVVVLLVGLSGLVIIGIAVLRNSPVGFQVGASAPATISVARGEELYLGRLITGTTTATCTVAPADGDSRTVSVRPGDDGGYRAPAWWSGTATITCDQPVGGSVYGRHSKARSFGLVAAATAVLLTTYLAIAALFDWG